MIVNRLCPAGMPLAIRSINAPIMSDAVSRWSPVDLMSREAAAGKGTSAGCVHSIGPNVFSSGRVDTPPGTCSSDTASFPNRSPGGGTVGNGHSSEASWSQGLKASASMALA